MNLDAHENFKTYDTKNVYGSITLLGEQLEEAWREVHTLETPDSCSLARNIIVAGMGGSALGGRVVKSLCFQSLRASLEIVTEYSLPHYVGPETLVILSSYSGNTEETLSAAHEALEKRAQIFVITTGGKLADFAKAENLPAYIFNPKNNPAGQPRLALGYSIGAIMAILAKCHFISITPEEIDEAVRTAKQYSQEFAKEQPESVNEAKKIARDLKGKMALIVASEHLVGAIHVMKNQLNESAKSLAVSFDIPELNHHLMEGLRNPAEGKKNLKFILFESDLYAEEIKRRYPITADVINQNQVEVQVIPLQSTTKITQVFELLTLGSFVQYYLAMLYQLDPAPIPWVDYFKKELAK
jgi:glucose/mannose-6-phosphate isomerase